MVQNPKVKNKLKKIAEKVKNLSPAVYEKTFYRLKDYVRNAVYEEGYLDNHNNLRADAVAQLGKSNLLWGMKVDLVAFEKPLVSIIVPNYNHALYLEERLESIYQQDYPNYEVILLDDCSSDDSISILKKYRDNYPNITTLCMNEQNGGGAFKQWNKGIALAKGKFIWIAESDDYCESNFLSELVPLFADESVMLAFCRSTFMQDGKSIYTTEEYLKEIDCFNWDRPFSVTAHEVVKNGWALKNIIPNVSSALFRNSGGFPVEVEDLWKELKLCGDWIFYLSLVKGGVLSYTNKVTNYYRVHAESTSLRIQKSSRYYEEFEITARYIMRNYEVPFEVFEKQKKILKDHYLCFHPDAMASDIEQWYRLSEIQKETKNKKPNVLMGGFSLIMGGGETFPIILANAMKEAGVAVTFMDFEMSGYDQKVREMLRVDIPLVKVRNLFSLSDAVRQLGADVIHSHHGCVDEVVSQLLQMNSGLNASQVITLHGMYESIENHDLERLIANVSKTCKQFVYTADKNLGVFKERTDIDYRGFVKIRNGLLKAKLLPIDRNSLGIEENAFVLCLVSRGIPDKGWREAVEAVALARKIYKIDIQLILIGNGEMYDLISGNCPDFVHLQGVQSNIRDYFACSDMGFLPSRFKGESYPLVVIDSLFSGKPVIASNIGEIHYQLQGDDGRVAGALFNLENWKIPIEDLANLIGIYAKRCDEYQLALKAVESASKKFDIHEIAKQYMNLYEKIVKEEGVIE